MGVDSTSTPRYGTRMRTLLIAVIVGVIASAGSATAASVITGKQIQNGSVTGKDLKNRSVTGRDLKRGTITGNAIAKRSLSTAELTQGAVAEMQAVTTTTKAATRRDVAPFDPQARAVVACPEGQVAVGGGGGWGYTSNKISRSQPMMNDDGIPVGWEITGSNSSAEKADTLDVFVICTPAPTPVAALSTTDTGQMVTAEPPTR